MKNEMKRKKIEVKIWRISLPRYVKPDSKKEKIDK